MDPISIGISAGAALFGFITKAVTDALAAGDRAKAIKILEENYEKAKGIKPPKQDVLEAIQQVESSLTSFKEDPRLKNQQMRALEALQSEVEMRGMTPEAREQYDLAREEAGGLAAGLEGAAAMRAAQRGIGGLGAYVGALGGSQAASNRAGRMGVGIAADARRRYLQALEGLGALGGQVRGQEFGFAAQRASAQDAINRFNAEQQAEANKWNIQAGERDLDNQLAILEAQMQAGQGLAGGYMGEAKAKQQLGEDVAAGINEAGKGAAAGIGSGKKKS